MSTYWLPKNKKYSMSMVLESLSTGVQTEVTFDVLFIKGIASLVQTSSKGFISTASDVKITPGNSFSVSLPPGVKVVSIDTGGLPLGVATVEIKDGTKDEPPLGLVVNTHKSDGAGIPSATASSQAAPS